jgi:hypothetical protein
MAVNWGQLATLRHNKILTLPDWADGTVGGRAMYDPAPAGDVVSLGAVLAALSWAPSGHAKQETHANKWGREGH